MRNLLLNQHFSIVFFLTVFAFGSFANAQSGQQKNPLEKFAALGPGVYNIKCDEDTGEIKSLIVVGTAPINPLLGPMSKDHAINEASIYCAAEFSRWAGPVEDEMNNEAQLRLMTSFLKHAETLYCKVDAKNEECVVIKGLNIEKIMAAKKSAQTHNNNAPAKPAK